MRIARMPENLSAVHRVGSFGHATNKKRIRWVGTAHVAQVLPCRVPGTAPSLPPTDVRRGRGTGRGGGEFVQALTDGALRHAHISFRI